MANTDRHTHARTHIIADIESVFGLLLRCRKSFDIFAFGTLFIVVGLITLLGLGEQLTERERERKREIGYNAIVFKYTDTHTMMVIPCIFGYYRI